MMRANSDNLGIDTITTKMTGKQHILILHILPIDKSKSKEFLAGKKLIASLFYR